jgi:hypothetical protein
MFSGIDRTKTRNAQLIRLYACLAFLLMLPICEAAMADPGTEKAGDYPHRTVGHHAIGEAGRKVWMFYPETPRPESAGVVLFLHGWGALDPAPYGAWIGHIVKRENIVLYPLFEESWRASPESSLQNAIESTKQALQYLADNGPVTPDLSHFSILGHSFGGGLAAQVAGLAAEAGLPEPKALMPVQPGWLASKTYPTDNLARIPPTTYLLVVEGDKDQFQNSRHGSTIIEATTQIPATHKAFVRLLSRGGLIADHYAPLAPDPAYHLEKESVGGELRKKMVKLIMGIRDGETDALDRQGLWPMFDELVSVAASGGTIDTPVKAATVEISVGQ